MTCDARFLLRPRRPGRSYGSGHGTEPWTERSRCRIPNTVKLVGDRFKPLTYREMTPEQKKMFESLISGERRGAGGPFNVLLRSPEMGDLAQKFGASMRFHSTMPPRLNELAIIITARHWTSHYEWYAHRRAAPAERGQPGNHRGNRRRPAPDDDAAG